MMLNKYSITSNEAKLFKHLDNLQAIQDKQARPIMIHIAPTNICNLKCHHCCFSDREKNREMSYDDFKKVIDQFYDLGVRAVEFTGGGEPTLYSYINEAIRYCKNYGMSLGINTNGVNVDKVHSDNWEAFKWIRVSLNVFDSMPDYREKFTTNVKFLQEKSKVTACYIASKGAAIDTIHNIISFANSLKLHTRIAPDCINHKLTIEALIQNINSMMNRYPNENEYCFSSDFNVFLGQRTDNVCMIHMIKPFVYNDGYVYCCPSSELALENSNDVMTKFRVCKIEDIYNYYTSNFEVFHHDCSYCKYANQNEILNFVIKETEDNEFA